jgi:hypothetical protein
MMTFKSSLIAVAVAMILVAGAASSSADTYHAPMNSVPHGQLGVHIVDQAYWGEGVSGISVDLKSGPKSGTILCGGQTGTACDFDALGALRMRANLVLPKCADSVEEDCIDDLAVYKSGTPPKSATFLKQVAGSTTEPDLAQNLTRGSTSSLWNAEGVNNSDGVDTYSVLAVLNMQRDSAATKFKAGSLSIMVMPYIERSSQWQTPATVVQNTRADGLSTVGGQAGNPDCAWVDQGKCGFVSDFAPETRVRLSLRLTNALGGWFKGRLNSPDIEISNFSAKANKVVLDAGPSSVPQFFSQLDLATGPTDLVSFMHGGSSAPSDPHAPGSTSSTWSDQPSAFAWVDKFRAFTKDTAFGVSTIWSAGTIQSGRGDKCLSDTSKVLGIVSTNSTVYEGQAPSFEGNTLAYKVAGLHYLPGGAEAATGTYDLVMRSEVARCLYGFSKAPVSAVISVVSTNGENKVATTTIIEKGGWLKLGAYGFTFSENTISAKITQASSPSVKPSTITCTKGKQVKKVTAIAPKCPTGFKTK